MSKAKRWAAFAALGFALLLCALLIFPAPRSGTAQAYGPYSYSVEHYTVEMNVSADRTIEVKEVISVAFNGYSAHGIIRDFPLENGMRYRDIKATCDNADFSPYTQTDDISFLSLYLRGEGVVTGQTRTYTIEYTLLVPALADGNYLPLDVIGYGWTEGLSDVSGRVTVPESCVAFNVYSGRNGTTGNDCGVETSREGNTISFSVPSLGAQNGITLDLNFSEGALSVAADDALFYALGVGAGLLLLAVLVKVFLCRAPLMTTTVNLSPPEGMDPLAMGMLVDFKADGEDLGALVFWLADRGYLTIDMKDKDDPILVKTDLPPDGLPGYVRVFYDGLFLGRSSVSVGELKNTFYGTANGTIAACSSALAEDLREPPKSRAVSLALGIAGAVALGLLPFLYCLFNVFAGYLYWIPLLCTLIAAGAAALGVRTAVKRRYKWAKWKLVGSAALGLLLAAAAVLPLYAWMSAGVTFAACTVCVVFAALVGGVAGSCFVPSKSYSEKLGQILGFKQFILYTERDKIAVMLEQQPELYYSVLPYAQALGVTDVWTDKFKGLSVAPPTYMTGYVYGDAVFDFLFWNAMFRSVGRNLAHNMVSRPASSGGGGVHGGGFGGGFGGGGFGGGGGRGC